MPMEVLGNQSHWVTADGSGEPCSGEFRALCKARGLWDLLMEGLDNQWPNPAAPAKKGDNPMERRIFDFVMDGYSNCCNVFSCVLGWDKT